MYVVPGEYLGIPPLILEPPLEQQANESPVSRPFLTVNKGYGSGISLTFDRVF